MRVTLDFEGFLDGAPIPDSRMEQVTVTLGTAQLMPAAEQAVYGHCAGETFRFDFTYPDEFRVPELSGKTAQFEICLHTVEQKQEPTVDDALAQRLGWEQGLGKNVFDVGCVILTCAIGLLASGHVIGIGIGTLIAMLGVGRSIALVNHLFREKMCRSAGLEQPAHA